MTPVRLLALEPTQRPLEGVVKGELALELGTTPLKPCCISLEFGVTALERRPHFVALVRPPSRYFLMPSSRLLVQLRGVEVALRSSIHASPSAPYVPSSTLLLFQTPGRAHDDRYPTAIELLDRPGALLSGSSSGRAERELDYERMLKLHASRQLSAGN